jgi:hypothetical protein
MISTYTVNTTPFLSYVPVVPVPGWPAWRPGGGQSMILPPTSVDLVRLAVQMPVPASVTMLASEAMAMTPELGERISLSAPLYAPLYAPLSAPLYAPLYAPPALRSTPDHMDFMQEILRLRDADRDHPADGKHYVEALWAMTRDAKAGHQNATANPTSMPVPKRARIRR